MSSRTALLQTTRKPACGIDRLATLLAAGIVLCMFGARAAQAQDAACPQLEAPTDPASCKPLYEGIGLPVSNKDEDDSDFTYVCHEQFLVRHNNKMKIPDWVIEHLDSEMVSGDNKRPKVSFRPEPCAPASGRAADSDYTNSRYARGHQAASDDFSANVDWMKDTFVLSNAVPQESEGFNSSIWAQFEKNVRDLAAERGELYVITGPVYQNVNGGEAVLPAARNPCDNEIHLPALPRAAVCGGTSNGPASSCANGVAIPAGLFKIIVDPVHGRINAYLLPNTDHRLIREGGVSTADYLARWRVSVRNIEDDTGYTFLPGLGRHASRAQKETCPATMFR